MKQLLSVLLLGLPLGLAVAATDKPLPDKGGETATTGSPVAEKVTLTVANPSDRQRQEVVEVSLEQLCQQLHVAPSAGLIVRNAFGQEVTYQRTYDGKLLLYVSVQPQGRAVFTVAEGRPLPFKSFVYGRVYPERADDITWENDRGIYRVYGPALQRTGERSFGTDVWTKCTPELVVEDRYKTHFQGMHLRDSLRKAGETEAAREADLAFSFHHDHGYGLDCYGVGPSLGCGAPALMRDGKLEPPYCYQQYKILDNGPLRFTVRLTYGKRDDGITEHRLISLDRGSHFCRMTVRYEGADRTEAPVGQSPLAFATGVVLHGRDHLVMGRNFVQYADPTDTPDVHQSQIYVATLFPEGIDETLLLEGEKDHALGIVRNYDGRPYTYYFGSAWSSYDVRTQAQWQLVIDEFLDNLSNPLKTQLQ